MPRISYSQVNSLPDILDQTAFELVFGSIPLGGNAERLTYKCQNVSIPGMSTEAYEAMLHGFVKRFRGRKTYPRQLSASFYEDMEFGTLNMFRAWSEAVAGSESGNSRGYQADYSINAYLFVYDTTGREIAVHTMEGFFPQDVPDVQMDGSSSGAVSVPITFSYDRFLVNGQPLL